MIRIIEDTIFNAKEKVIAHQVNCQGKMMSGIADDIRLLYPIVYTEYFKLWQKHIIEKKPLLGICQMVYVPEIDKHVANLFGQQYYGKNAKFTNYNALVRAITRLTLTCNCDIAIPYRMGCDKGGGDWNKLYHILEILAEDFKHDIVIYKLPPKYNHIKK